MAVPDSKACSKCKQILPASAFTADRRSSTGLQPRCKPCLAAVARARRYANPDAEREAAREYRENNPDKINEWSIRYREKHRERLRLRAAKYYAANRERCIEWTRQDRKKHPERTRELARGWQARRRDLKRDGATAVETAAWAETQKKVCHWCGKPCAKQFEIDHLTPLSKGGRHEIRNLAISCRSCNRRKHARDPIEWAQMIGKLL